MPIVEYLQGHPASFIVVSTVLGLILGSFLNVVIHRLPVMMEREWRSQCEEYLAVSEPQPAREEPYNLVVPRSRCPHCGHHIAALENVPVLSYLALGGKCSACGTAISIRYPLIEIATAVLTALVAWHYGFGVQAGFAFLLTWALIALAVIDVDHQLLPDAITLPFLWLGLAVNLGEVFVDSRASLLGAMAGYGLLWCIFHAFRLLTGKEGMGYGDFKLLAMLGAWAGWQSLPVVILLASFIGAVVGITLILVRGHDRRIPIPFGPYLAGAGLISLMWGQDLVRWYLAW